MADKTKDLKKKLFSQKKNGWDRISAAEGRKIDAYCKRYMAFLDAGKTERLCAAEAIRLASDNHQAAEAAFAFQHELAMLSGNTLLPLIFRSFYSSVLVLWERFCALYGISMLYETSYRLCDHIRNRDILGAVSWIDYCTQEAISGSRQIYY